MTPGEREAERQSAAEVGTILRRANVPVAPRDDLE
jgi:hypothetical protein